jgi:hypothetical protein
MGGYVIDACFSLRITNSIGKYTAAWHNHDFSIAKLS